MYNEFDKVVTNSCPQSKSLYGTRQAADKMNNGKHNLLGRIKVPRGQRDIL